MYDPRRILDSRFFTDARAQAERLLRDPSAARKLVDQVVLRMEELERQPGPIGQLFERLGALVRMVRAYVGGSYRDLPTKTILLCLAGLVYFIMPADVIPDFVLGFGLIDDAAVLGFILNSIQGDLTRFKKWEEDRA